MGPELTTCCFIFDLKTGNTIIGVVNAMWSFMMFVILVVMASMAGSLQNNELIEIDPEAEAAATGLYVICIMLVFMYLIKFFSDLLFIYGVTVGHTGIIKGYLIVWCVFFLLSSFLFFLHVMDFQAYAIVAQLLYIALNVYAILLATSYYKQLNIREEI